MSRVHSYNRRMAEVRHLRVLQRLGNVPVASFMREAWQRKPLLIRAALPGFDPPVTEQSAVELFPTRR